MTLNITMLCHYAKCHYAVCHVLSIIMCHYAECRYAECRYAECRYAECRGTLENFLKGCLFQIHNNLIISRACIVKPFGAVINSLAY